MSLESGLLELSREVEGHLAAERWEDARALIQQMMLTYSQEAVVWCLEAQMRMGMADWEAAELALGQAQQLDPFGSEPMLLWARYCGQMKRYAEAVQSAADAVAQAEEPEERREATLLHGALVWAWLCDAQWGEEDEWDEDGQEEELVMFAQEALSMLEEEEYIPPELPAQGWALQARFLRWLGEPEEASRIWPKAIERAPQELDYAYEAAQNLEDLEEFEEAHAAYMALFAREQEAFASPDAPALRVSEETFAEAAQEAWQELFETWELDQAPVEFAFSTMVYPSLAMMEESSPDDLFDPRVGLHVAFHALLVDTPTVEMILFQRNIERDLEGDDPTGLTLAIRDLLESCLDRVTAIIEEEPEEDF